MMQCHLRQKNFKTKNKHNKHKKSLSLTQGEALFMSIKFYTNNINDNIRSNIQQKLKHSMHLYLSSNYR